MARIKKLIPGAGPSVGQRAAKKTTEFFVEQGGKLYRFIRGVDDVNDLRDAIEGGAKITRRPPPRSIANAKPFSELSGSGRTQSSVPSAAQRAERAAQASRMPKPKPPATQTGTGGGGKPPVRVSGPPQRGGARRQDIVVAKPRQVATPKPRPQQRLSGPPKRSGARMSKADQLRAMVAAAIASSQASKKPKGMPEAKASPSMKMPKPRPPVQGPPRPSKKASPGPVGPVRRGGAQKNIDAGGNTGFGIKGNQFVGGPEERAIMMKYYGGTGSAAAKAALEGKQGILKSRGMDALKKELQEARAKRLARTTNEKKKGGMVVSKKKKSAPKKTEVVARQMRGWGKARKPKR